MSPEERTAALRIACAELPGSTPYTNHRPMGVTKRYDGRSLSTFLTERHHHIPLATWTAALQTGRLTVDGRIPPNLAVQVRAGNRIVISTPNTVEPDVASDLVVLHEDDAVLVLHKSAPLPVHPCGRFNRNTVVGLLAHAFPKLIAKPVHRLDADTTGVLILAKTTASATALSRQFERRTTQKVYLALVHGTPPHAGQTSTPLGQTSTTLGKRQAQSNGAPALTRWRRIGSNDHRSLLELRPQTGRTHQLRIHLAELGHPILGDFAYGPDQANEAFTSARTQLHLHAHSIEIRHPLTGKTTTFTAQRPTWARLTTKTP